MTKIGENKGGFIETYTGKKFNFMAPTDEMIDITDIAHSLSMQCRYTGHVRKFYSVAEHCCLLHDYALNVLQDPVLALEVLMHDASEAYLTDVPRPIKPFIPEYYNIEANIEKAINKKYVLRHPHSDTVKSLDSRILMDERAQAMSKSGLEWSINLEPLGVTLRFWNPERGETEFKNRFLARKMSNVAEHVLAPCDAGE